MTDFKKEHTLIIEALKFSEEELRTVCKKVDDQQLYTLLEAITHARNTILDAMMARTMERNPNPIQWNDADKAVYVVKAIEDELINRIKNKNKKCLDNKVRDSLINYVSDVVNCFMEVFWFVSES